MDAFSYFGLPSIALEIGLRLPPLYLMDTILLRDWGLKAFVAGESSSSSSVDQDGRHIYLHTNVDREQSPRLSLFGRANDSLDPEDLDLRLLNETLFVVPYLFNFFLCLLVYAASLFLITLSPRQLGVFYAYGLALLCLPASYAAHDIMIQATDDRSQVTQKNSHLKASSSPRPREK